MDDPVREGPAGAGRHERIWPRRQAGPLAVVMMELIDWLVAEGYAPTTQRNHVRAAARLGSWLDAKGIELEDVDAACVIRLVEQDNERHPGHRSANENASAVALGMPRKVTWSSNRVRPPRATYATIASCLIPMRRCPNCFDRIFLVEQIYEVTRFGLTPIGGVG